MEGTVKYRNMFLQVILFIVTLGIYGIYWFFQTAVEMKVLANDPEASPGLLTFLLFIPFGNFYSVFKYGQLYNKAFPGKMGPGLFLLLWIIFSPACWFIVQSDLNKKAAPMPVTA